MTQGVAEYQATLVSTLQTLKQDFTPQVPETQGRL